MALALFAGHFVLDFFSGHAHHVFGEDTHQVGFGFYASNVYLAILIETAFVAAALWFYFSCEAKAGIKRTPQNRAVIIGVFVYAILFLVVIATTSIRQWLSLPAFDLGFNTSVPTLFITYIAMMWILYRAVPQDN